MSGKTGTTESHRSSAFLGFTNQYAAANYIFDDTPKPSGLCSFPLRRCANGDLYGGKEPARTWFLAMDPIADDFGPVELPPTDPRYVTGGPGSEVPSVTGLKLDAARKRLQDAGFQVADKPTPINSYSSRGAVVGTTPKGRTIPGSIIAINTSNGIAPAPVYQPDSSLRLRSGRAATTPASAAATAPGCQHRRYPGAAADHVPGSAALLRRRHRHYRRRLDLRHPSRPCPRRRRLCRRQPPPPGPLPPPADALPPPP